MYNHPSNSNAGGVAIYVNNKLDHFTRDDWLMTLSRCGLKLKKLWGCIYRYPTSDVTKFVEYIETMLTKLNNKNYDIFLMGDFKVVRNKKFDNFSSC